MPKRPLSAYNIFFRVERQRILGEGLSKEYEITDQSKRKHRKTHGKVGFAEMAQKISTKWKSMPSSERQPFEQEAHIEKQRYNHEVKQWRKDRDKLAAIESGKEIFRQITLDKSSSAEDPALGAADTTLDDEKEKATSRDDGDDDDDAGAEYKHNRKGHDVAFGHDTSSPRSETAAFLVTLPSSDGGVHVTTAPSLPETAGSRSEILAPQHPAIADGRSLPFFVQTNPGLQASPTTYVAGATIPMSRLAPPPALSSRSSWPPGSNERARQLEELYRYDSISVLADACSKIQLPYIFVPLGCIWLKQLPFERNLNGT